MATWKPDPTFYPSPRLAAQAPPEKLAYVAMFDPQRIGGKANIPSQRLRCRKHAEKLLPQRICTYCGDEMATVPGLKYLVGHNAGVRVTPPPSR